MGIALDQVRHTDNAQIRLVGLHGLAGKGNIASALGQDGLDHIHLGAQLAAGIYIDRDPSAGLLFHILFELQGALVPGVALIIDMADVDLEFSLAARRGCPIRLSCSAARGRCCSRRAGASSKATGFLFNFIVFFSLSFDKFLTLNTVFAAY